jgi:hypothetical protein
MSSKNFGDFSHILLSVCLIVNKDVIEKCIKSKDNALLKIYWRANEDHPPIFICVLCTKLICLYCKFESNDQWKISTDLTPYFFLTVSFETNNNRTI